MPTAGVRAPSAAFQPTSGTTGSWTWIDVEVALAHLAARGDDAAGRERREVGDRAVGARSPTVRPSGTR